MACLDMFNPEHQGLCTPMSPRISFSNDFIDTTTQQTLSSREAPPVASEHFEFSVCKYTMMPADELFSKGTLLPFKKATLRDELLMDHEEDDVSVRPPKVPTRWKEFWGLKKTHQTHIVNKKADKIVESMERVVGVHESKISQEVLADREAMDRDVEMGT